MPHIVMTLAVPDNTGASRMAHQFAVALGRRGHPVTVAHGPVPQLSADDSAPSILPAMHAAGIATVLVEELRRPLGPAARRKVALIASDLGAGALIGVQQRDRTVALQAAHRLGIVGVTCLQNRHVFWGTRLLRFFKERRYRWALARYADAVVCAGEDVHREAIERFGARPERCFMVPNGIDVEGWSRPDVADRIGLRQSIGVAPEQLLFINVARVDLQKGQDVLVRSLALLPEPVRDRCKVVLVGGVTHGANHQRMLRYRQDLLESAARLGVIDRLVLLGYRADVQALLSVADVFVLASRWEGGSSLGVSEAMCGALPIITTDGAGRPIGFVDGEHGYVVPSGDERLLARAIEALVMAAPAERVTMGDRCRQLAQREYDIRALADRFVDIVERTISDHR